MIELVKRAAAKLERFTEDPGQPLDWTRSGSLKVARRPEDVQRPKPRATSRYPRNG